MIERESPQEEAQRRLAEGKVKLDKLKALAKGYDTLLGSGGDLLERAYMTYMEGDRIEDWEEFEKCMRGAVSSFKDAMKQLHLIAEVTPSSVEPERYVEISGIISVVNNVLLSYHQTWGKRLIKEENTRIMAITHWTCAALLAHGIPNGDMESVAGEAYCKNECRFREGCDREGL